MYKLIIIFIKHITKDIVKRTNSKTILSKLDKITINIDEIVLIIKSALIM